MKNSFKWILSAAALVVLIVGATLLYNNFSEKYGGQNLQQVSSSEDGTAASGNAEGDGAQSSGGSAAENSNPAPDFAAVDAEGRKVKLSDFEGKPVVLNFWASWCHFCKQGMPNFEQAMKDNPDTQILMVNMTDGSVETLAGAKGFIESEGYTFDVLYDTEGQAAEAFYVTSMPVTYFIDASGNIVTYGNGALSLELINKGIGLMQ